MNEELQKRMLESLDKIAEWIEQAEIFTKEQAPLVVQEILDYGFAKELTQTLASALLMIMGFVAAFICYRHFDRTDNEDFAIAALVIFIVTIPLFPVTIFEFLDVLKVVVAPRLYVLEQLRGLL